MSGTPISLNASTVSTLALDVGADADDGVKKIRHAKLAQGVDIAAISLDGHGSAGQTSFGPGRGFSSMARMSWPRRVRLCATAPPNRPRADDDDAVRLQLL
ncbi:MAG: hypothetical protein KL785_02005 [Brevundimonas sp.]|nr:hypothetical protein [Brevundimonas sp.]